MISPAGDVMPCGYATHPGNAFGNLERTPFAEIWDNAAYRYSRSLFVRPLSERAHSDVRKNLCTTCPNFRQRSVGRVKPAELGPRRRRGRRVAPALRVPARATHHAAGPTASASRASAPARSGARASTGASGSPPSRRMRATALRIV